MGTRARADVRPEIRGALKRAIKIMEADGRPLSTIWLEMFQEDPFKAMGLAIQLQPKEIEATVEHVTPEQWLEIMADAADARESEGAESTDSVSGPVH